MSSISESGAHLSPVGLLTLKRYRVLNYAGICTLLDINSYWIRLTL